MTDFTGSGVAVAINFRKRIKRTAALMGTGLLALLFSNGAAADVASMGSSGFEIHRLAHIAAAPALVYAALIAPARWWDPQHTYSGQAENLTLDARAGGYSKDGFESLSKAVDNVLGQQLARLQRSAESRAADNARHGQ
jgi:hypothetical protein